MVLCISLNALFLILLGILLTLCEAVLRRSVLGKLWNILFDEAALVFNWLCSKALISYSLEERNSGMLRIPSLKLGSAVSDLMVLLL